MDYKKFADYSPCDYVGALKRENFMDVDMKPLWQDIPRVVGPAFTVNMVPGDNLALHKAIYEAPKGFVIVAQTNSMDYAVSGGNVCSIAQGLGIAGFVIDGVVRDIGEVRQMKFPIFAKGIHPMPGTKKAIVPLNTPIVAGGIAINPGDIIVADEEGIAVIPKDIANEVYEQTKAKMDDEAVIGLEKWAENHRKKIESFYK